MSPSTEDSKFFGADRVYGTMIADRSRGARRALLTLAVLALGACSEAPTAVAPAGSIDLALQWQSVTPDLVNLDAAQLASASASAQLIPRMRSLLVVREGRLAHEEYFGGWTADTLADVRSVTKSIVSTLTGIALQRGELESLDQSIVTVLTGPEFALPQAQWGITIRHLLTMTSGFFWDESDNVGTYGEWIRSGDHLGFILDRPLIEQPGASFTYNSAAVHLLGVVLEEATGRTLPDYADEVLFEPIGVRDRKWESFSSGRVNGGAGIDLRPRDLARIGQLFLQRGWSGGTSIVPSPWIDEATQRRFSWTVPAGPIAQVSYGFLWWVDVDNDAYFAWGFAGQFVYVVPSLDLVVVATTDWRGVRDDVGNVPLQEAVLDIIVNGVLPAVR